MTDVRAGSTVSSTVDSGAPPEAGVRAPGRPRSAAVDEAILEAVLDLLAERTPLEALSIEAVATKAGVGKATIYRRWANKDALLLDAIRRLKGPPPIPPGISIRDDLIMVLNAMNQGHDRRSGAIMPCLVPEVHRSEAHYRLYQEIVSQRREVMRAVLQRGIAIGELRADIDVEMIMLMLVGPMLTQKLLRWHPDIDMNALPGALVDAVLAGISVR